MYPILMEIEHNGNPDSKPKQSQTKQSTIKQVSKTG